MIADGFTVSDMIDIRVRQTGFREDEEERERYKKRGGGAWKLGREEYSGNDAMAKEARGEGGW